ncbi:uncharacterized protein LOC124268920 [Haliotis rubra]|uniref:uncharacterized protein LOC124268920 n=1 Tax=Haliotis rubra TaxID=36100 RepID=UPI001EE52D35|nr:uncharacterized protein LOC124268920 [Haliotis rubra]
MLDTNSYFLALVTLCFTMETSQSMTCGGVEYKSFTKLEQRIHTFEKEVFDDYGMSTEGAWYGEPGYKLLDFAPGLLHCGGRYPAWVQGKQGGDSEGQHQLTMCMQHSSDDCYRTWTIDAMSCEDQTIYKLTKPPTDKIVYCVGYVNEDNPPSTHLVDSCSVEIQTRENDYQGFAVFLCNFERLNMPLHYETYWFVNDKYVAVKDVALWSENYVESSRLTEDDLKKAGFHKFGFDVRCSVRLRDTAGGFPGPSRLSAPQFAGITVESEGTESRIRALKDDTVNNFIGDITYTGHVSKLLKLS